MLPLSVMMAEVSERSLWNVELIGILADVLYTIDFVWMAFRLASKICLCIRARRDDGAGNIKRVPRRFGDSQTIVESDAARDSTKADDDTYF